MRKNIARSPAASPEHIVYHLAVVRGAKFACLLPVPSALCRFTLEKNSSLRNKSHDIVTGDESNQATLVDDNRQSMNVVVHQ